jgi:hypothetical protein
MSIEREFLKKLRYVTHLENDLRKELEEVLAKPEQAVEECTNSDTWNCKYCNKTESCGALKDSRNFAPPKREPLSSIKILELTSKHEYAINLIRAVEKAHGIGGGE